jgi:AraC-like DNA-binding protein
MDIGRVKLSKGRDFFVLRAPREAFGGLIGPTPHGQATRSVILDLQRRQHDVGGVRVDGAPVRVIPFPHGHRARARIHTSAQLDEAGETLEVLLPRRTFDQLADRQGATRVKGLDLEAGLAADDTVLRHLAEGLEHGLAAPDPGMAAAVDPITEAITVRLAQRYGGLQPARPQRGGLAPWQLRLAWAFFDKHLDGSAPLDGLARQSGLSVSHFSRAFRRSTGLAPHRWLLQRRVEVAKDMMLAEPVPLAQVAVACGFADQSHFTRTFASLIGLTPARWRTVQEQAFALGEDRNFTVGVGRPALAAA